MNARHLAAAAVSAVCAFVAAPAFAGADIEGAYAAINKPGYTGGGRIAGAYSAPVADWNFQVDGEYGSFDKSAAGGNRDHYSGAVHLGKAGMNGYFGVYAAAGSTFNIDNFDAGVEMQANYRTATFGLRGGVGQVDGDNTAFNADVIAAFYARDDVAVTTEAGWMHVQNGLKRDLYVGRATVEWKPARLPVSVFASNSFFDNEIGPNWLWSVGARWQFGAGGSFKDRDQTGQNLRKGSAFENVYIR